MQPEAVAASASIPIMFQPTPWGDMQMVDGGVYSNTNLEEAIKKCKAHVDSDDKIIVDVLMCQSDPVEMGTYKKENMFNALNVHNRKKQIRNYYDTMDDIYPFVRAYPDVNYRYIVAASETLPSNAIVPVIVSQDDLEKSYAIGYKDG
jgi:predicted acylesterase/phospholipase RssA